MCIRPFYPNEVESGVTKEQYEENENFRFNTSISDRIVSAYDSYPNGFQRLLNRGMNLENMYAILINDNTIYANLSFEAKNTWIFSKPMADIEMSINNLEEHFMENDKRFKHLATTVRIGAEKLQEYESIASVNIEDYDNDSEYVTDSDEELKFSDTRKKKKVTEKKPGSN